MPKTVKIKKRVNPYWALSLIGAACLSACGLPEDPFPRRSPTHVIQQTDTNFYREGQTLFSASKQNCQKTWQQWVTSCAFFKTIRIPVLSNATEERTYTGSVMLSFTCHALNDDAKLYVSINETSVTLSPKPITQIVTYRTNDLDVSSVVDVELEGSWSDKDIISNSCTVSLLTDPS